MTTEYQNIHENRKYKDTLFRMVFKEKEHLLELYNAVNYTDYQNPDELQINTLENVLYISMKNDISFIIDSGMNLYEHQSTKNENMPLRGYLYFAKLLEDYISENDLDLFSSRLQKIPTPKYLIFYNGEENEPDERILRLSDAFIKEGGCIECEARLLNINVGRNRELMERCRRLEEYSIFVATVRRYKKEGNPLKMAITQAIEECIEKGILLDILLKERKEVQAVVLETFNQELYEKNLKADAYEDGIRVGMEQGIQEGIQKGESKKLLSLIERKLAKGKTTEQIAEELEESEETILELMHSDQNSDQIRTTNA